MKFLFFIFCISSLIVAACSNSESVSYEKNCNNTDDFNEFEINSFHPDETEYPFAGISRIVIETQNRQSIKDKEKNIPAKFQIWGENTPESEIFDMTIRGHGNSSWWTMAKKSYKIEFTDKHDILGMPKNRDWVLISNHADKTLMRNYLVYKIAPTLGAYYAPQCQFAELFLNGKYLGVYLVVETIKIGKNRINIPKNNDSYIIEFDEKYQADDQVFFSSILQDNKPFRIHFPKESPDSVVETIKKHLTQFELYLKNNFPNQDSIISSWIDLKQYIIHYWIQEVAKNPDAAFYTSVYFSWTKNGKIKMGPIWDFDVAFGNYQKESLNIPEKWELRAHYWNSILFKSNLFNDSIRAFWKQNHTIFSTLSDSIETQREYLRNSAQNNFKRWNVLNKTSDWVHAKAFNSYDEAVDSLKSWLDKRLTWINNNID